MLGLFSTETMIKAVIFKLDHPVINEWIPDLKKSSCHCLRNLGVRNNRIRLSGLPGLIGFAEYESERKTREIGIRKALGAARTGIALHFIRIAVIAETIACKLSYLFVRIIFYKIDYPYSFYMGISVFLLAGGKEPDTDVSSRQLSDVQNGFGEPGRCAAG
jgi:hypothetical protein